MKLYFFIFFYYNPKAGQKKFVDLIIYLLTQKASYIANVVYSQFVSIVISCSLYANLTSRKALQKCVLQRRKKNSKYSKYSNLSDNYHFVPVGAEKYLNC